MKAIWTVLFAAVAAAILAIALLLWPSYERTDKFWLSLCAIGAGVGFMYIAFTFQPAPQGEQGGSVMRGSLWMASVMYFVATLALSLIAATGISFNWLAILHILAGLFAVAFVCFGAMGATAMSGADRQKGSAEPPANI